MKCKKCGANLLDTDKFCDQCGWKVVKQRRCPECGAALREGTKFCPKCGVLVGSSKSDEGKVYERDEETSEMPIGDIEQNILSETERELHTGKKKHPTSAPKKAVPAPEPKKKKKTEPVRKKLYEEWDDEDEDDEDDDDTGNNFMVIMTAAMAFLIIVLAVPFFLIVKGKFPVKNYDVTAEKEQDNEMDDVEAENDGEPEPEEDNTIQIEEPDSEQPVGTLSIVGSDKVNVRDNPSTEGTNVIKHAKAGDTYEYMGTTEDGEWYIILLEDGSIGYVFGQYVSAH